MANTTIPIELSSTPGIVDNSNATAITIDSSENVGIGTTSPTNKAHIYKAASGRAWTPDGADVLAIENNDSIAFDIRCPDSNQGLILFSDASARARGIVGYEHSSDAMYMSTAGSERLRITSAGNVGIGTASPSTLVDIVGTGTDLLKLTAPTQAVVRISRTSGAELDVSTSASQALIRTNTNHPIDFLTNGSQRMRIDSGGYVGMGVTNPNVYSSRLVLNSLGTYTLWQTSTGVTRGVFGSSESGGQNWTYSTAGTGNYGSANGDLIWQNGSNVTFMRFDQSATTVVGDFVDTSDVGLKENIVDTTDGLTKIMQLQPRKFDWKEENKQQQVNGFIAQELETILPNEVSGDDYDEENPDHGHKAINTSGVLAVAVKAIQEQQTIIESLEARITALES